MALTDDTISSRKFSFGVPAQKDNATSALDPVAGNVPRQYEIVSTDYLNVGDNEVVTAAWNAAMIVANGDPSFSMGEPGLGPFDETRFQSYITSSVSAVADATSNPASFDLRIYGRVNDLDPYQDPTNAEWGGGINVFLTNLLADPVNGGGGLGANAFDHYPNSLSVPAWAGAPGQPCDGWMTGITVPAVPLSTDLYVGLTACRTPSVSKQNPKTGIYEYTNEEVVLGFKMQPETVTVAPVTGDLTFQIGNHKLLTEATIGGGTQLNHTGRRVRVYARNPKAVTGVAIQEVLTSFVVGINTVVVPGGLGDGTAATNDPIEYIIVVIGPVVTDYDLWQANLPHFPGGLQIVGKFTKDPGGLLPWYRDELDPDPSYAHSYSLPTFSSLMGPRRGFIDQRTIENFTDYVGPGPMTGVTDSVFRIVMRQAKDEPNSATAFRLMNDLGTNTFSVDFSGAMYLTSLWIDPGSLFVRGTVTSEGGFNNNDHPAAVNEFTGDVAIGTAVACNLKVGPNASWFGYTDLFMDVNTIGWSATAPSTTTFELDEVTRIRTKDMAATGTPYAAFHILPKNTVAPAVQVSEMLLGDYVDPTQTKVLSGHFYAENALNLPFGGGYFTAEGALAKYAYTGKVCMQNTFPTQIAHEMFGFSNFLFPSPGPSYPWITGGFFGANGLGQTFTDQWSDAQFFGIIAYPQAFHNLPIIAAADVLTTVPLKLIDTVAYSFINFHFTWNFPNVPVGGLGSNGSIDFEIYEEKMANIPMGGGLFQPPIPNAFMWHETGGFQFDTTGTIPHVPQELLYTLGNPIVTVADQQGHSHYHMALLLSDNMAQGYTSLLHGFQILGFMTATPTQLVIA